MSAQQSTIPAWESNTVRTLKSMAESLTHDLLPWKVPSLCVKSADFGAIGDGATVNTEAIQKAVDSCAERGGGVVLFENGRFVTGTIELRSGVMIEVAENASILGSISLSDYPEHFAKRRTVMDTHMGMHQSLFFGEDVERVGFRGKGLIDFRGTPDHFEGRQTTAATPGRPFGIRILDSRKVVLQGITLKDAACWMQNYLNCEDVILDGVTVSNHANHNNDGIDIDGCRRVIIRNCMVNAEDDAMCIKGASMRPTEDVLIENSTFVTTCNAFKIGTDTQGDFRRIYARNLRLGGIPEELRTSKGRQASTGITVATVDGGEVQDIFFENVQIERTRAPIFIRRGDRGRLMPDMPHPPVARLERVVFHSISGSLNYRQGSLISGIPGYTIDQVALRDIQLDNEGGATEEMKNRVLDEMEGRYPDAQGFHKDGLPSYGCFVRHVDTLIFDRFTVTPREPDIRPLFRFAVDCRNVTVDGMPVQSES